MKLTTSMRLRGTVNTLSPTHGWEPTAEFFHSKGAAEILDVGLSERKEVALLES
jgi:hypothetical protein